MAIDTARFSSMPLDAGGGSSSVYGYGWGAILWFMAICVALAAAGTLEKELDSESRTVIAEGHTSQDSTPLRFVGLSLIILVLTFTGIWFYKDRSRANNAELQRLDGLAFKRGDVCAAPEPKAQSQVDITNGIVEVIIANGALGAYPFNGPNQLLEWGLPKVRFGNRDYYIGQLDGKRRTVSDAASGDPVARLFVSDGYIDGRSHKTAKLIVADGSQEIFNQNWLAETKSGERFCPEFSSFPAIDKQPRKLLSEALRNEGKMPMSLPSVAVVKVAETRRLTASIVSVKEYGARPIPNARRGWYNPQPAGSLGWKNNRNCPEKVGWGGAYEKQNSARLDTGWPFIIGEKSFYLEGSRDEYNALCQGDYVYLSTTSARDGKNFIRIEKRSLADFQAAWDVIVVIDKQITPYPVNNLKLNRVSEGDTGVTLSVINEHDWTEVEMTMPVAAVSR